MYSKSMVRKVPATLSYSSQEVALEASLNPHPSALVESMRSMGYSPRTALADLVDNSITAEARSVQIELSPVAGQAGELAGWIRIEDDGHGMDAVELFNAMRWGGAGPGSSRNPKDLGRFGLGLKTASVSLGRRLTVVSRKNNQLNAVRWDLDHIYKCGAWELLEGVDAEDEEFLEGTALRSAQGSQSGTIVLITKIDRLRIDGYTELQHQANKTAIIKKIRAHLGLVFHRFLQRQSPKIQLGSAAIQAWNPLGLLGRGEETEWHKSTELFEAGRATVRTFILPHYKALTEEQHERLGGPHGWNAHQGFLIYRSDRLIVPGGWLGFFRPEEHCKLARISVDLSNDLDSAWGLNVMKSSVRPPSALRGDLERIAAAARKSAEAAYRFHGAKEALEVASPNEEVSHQAFWKQIVGKHEVFFRINRGHPLVEALVQSVSKKTFAEPFLKAFERLLPVAAILQQPAKSTHGLVIEPDEEELKQLATALRLTIDVLIKTGLPADEAAETALSCQPFTSFHEALRHHLGT